MKRVAKELFSKQFILFVSVGGVAGVVNIISRAILNQFMGFEVAIVAAYGIGMAVAFLLTKHFVFEKSSHGSAGHEAMYFFLVNMVGVALVWIVSMSLVEFVFPWWASTFPDLAISRPRFIAHSIGVVSPTVSSYFGHKYLSFRQAPAGG